MDWWWQRKYLVLLTALLLLLVVYPMLRESVPGRLVLDIILTLFFAALLTVVFADRHRLLALALGIPTLVGLCVGYTLPDVPHMVASVAFHFLGALALSLCVIAI